MRYLRLLGIALLLSVPCRALAVVYRVKADAAGTPHNGSSWTQAFTTVQAGINAASSSDEVWVAQGTYTGILTTKDGVKLRGGYAGSGATPDDRNTSAYVTTLDGNHSGSVITVPANAGSGTVIEGFTITNGTGTAPLGYSVYGGGVYCLAASSPTITNCNFTNNSASAVASPPGRGGAIWCAPDGHPDIEGNMFAGNSALYGGAIFASAGSMTVRYNTFSSDTAVGSGGAMVIPTDGNASIIGNLFWNCSAHSGGGAIFCDTVSSATIKTNAFQANSSPGLGGAIYSDDASCKITSNVFIDNSGGEGDAVYAQGGVYIISNTFARNKAYYAGSDTGTLYFFNASQVCNNILMNNQVAIGYYSSGSSAAPFHNNCFYANTLDHDSKSPNMVGVNGNFNADPKLVDPASNDFHEIASSPCVDAGDSSYDASSDVDYYSAQRIYGAHVDIGASELVPHMVFSTQPGDGVKGGQLSPQPAVTMQDAQGSTYATNTGTVTLSLPSNYGTPGAALTGTISASFVNGVATFTNLGVDTGGTGYIASASSTGLTSIASDPFNVVIPRVYVTPTGSDSNEGASWATAKATIAAALAGVDSPGEVWAKAGSYNTNVTVPSGVSLLGGFRGSETTSTNRRPYRFVSTLTGTSGGPVVTIASGAGRSTVLDGFTITGGGGKALGLSPNTYRAGGGIYMTNSSPTVTRNTIMENEATIGGGIYANAGSPMIQYNTIQFNTAACNLRITGAGAGISLIGATTASVLDNVITNNSATGTNPFLGGQGALGGGVACASADPTLRNNTIAENSTSGSGGGIYLNGSSPALTSNIVAQNTSGLYAENSSHPTFRYNDISYNDTYDTYGVTYPVGVHGNITGDPLFVAEAYRDYHLKGRSPCLNAGDTAAVLLQENDLDGYDRIVGPNVDIGAYEIRVYTMTDTTAALRIAAGLATADYSDMGRLDMAPTAGDRHIAVADAVEVARKVAGLEANP